MSDAIRQAAELKPQAVMDAMDAASKAKDGHDGRWSWSTLAKELSDHIVIVQPAPIAGEEEVRERLKAAIGAGWQQSEDYFNRASYREDIALEKLLPIIREYVCWDRAWVIERAMRKLLAERVKEAVETEREACAKIGEVVSDYVARTIRARGKSEAER